MDPGLTGRTGRVSVSVPPEGGGEVLIDIRGGSEAFIAWPAEGVGTIPAGSRVVVVDQLSARTVSVAPF